MEITVFGLLLSATYNSEISINVSFNFFKTAVDGSVYLFCYFNEIRHHKRKHTGILMNIITGNTT